MWRIGGGGGVGAARGEIPLFGPRAGSVASAGMTERGTAAEAARGRFPLGGGNDGEKGRGMTGWGRDAAVVLRSARYPRQSAGMTEMGAGVTRNGAGRDELVVGAVLMLCSARYPRQARV